MRIPAAGWPPLTVVGCASSFSSLLKPFRSGEQAPSPDSSGRAVQSDRPGAVEISVACQVQDPAVQISIDVVRRTVGHEHDLVLDSPTRDILIKVERNRGVAESIRHRCRAIRYAGNDLEPDVLGQCDSSDLRGCGERRSHIPTKGL